jgi:arsenate reductase (glutaredoxin)
VLARWAHRAKPGHVERISVLNVTIYGIKNCDTMKKARSWLDDRGVKYAFHDYKAVGIDRERLEHWCGELGWEVLLNRAGTTFRKLPEQAKQALDARKAVTLMLAQPSLIKRPVLDHHGHLVVGFKPDLYERASRLGAKPACADSKAGR